MPFSCFPVDAYCPPRMALNKSMHARNRYKDKPPDFAYLASKYPEFKQHVQVNLKGRVR